ncbi:hypothetical protein SAMN05216505_101422 [Streptomyces prasinopilosus]|uniref:Uncharacterized protein n=1 Tax=Streptomyces prasinopilosus TaxID=67344 RepID=A0A1G6IWK3_9ACTN|nr:hypothetical protein SAMN05216505_101422 [Streptomyces prasinopilosus]
MPASIHAEVDHLFGAVSTRRTSTRLRRPSRGRAHPVPAPHGDGGAPFACTARGRDRS